MLKHFLNQMKLREDKIQGKVITITAERLSDHSRITFNFSSDRTIEELRALLNHHLPPRTTNKFFLYSYQRGALIHFHPSSFKLDYFPVIFDQSVLLLKMDDSTVEHFHMNNDEYFINEMKSHRSLSYRRSLNSKSSRQTSTSSCLSSTTTTSSSSLSYSSSNSRRKSINCSAIIRSLFSRCFYRQNISQYPTLLTS